MGEKKNSSKQEPEMKPLFEDMSSHSKVELDTEGLKKALEHQERANAREIPGFNSTSSKGK